MRRRGLLIFFAVLGLAGLFVAAGLFALYLTLGRGPSIPRDATLTLRVGGELSEIAPTDIVAYVSGARAPTVQGILDTLRKAKVDDRIRALLLKPTGFASPYWG